MSILRMLKIFNPDGARNKINKEMFNKHKISMMSDEIKNNPKFVQFFVDNLRYWVKIIDIHTMADDIRSDTLYSLLGEKRAYVRLIELLTKEIEVEFKDK